MTDEEKVTENGVSLLFASTGFFKVRVKVLQKWNDNWSREGKSELYKGWLVAGWTNPTSGWGTCPEIQPPGNTKEQAVGSQTSLSIKGEENKADTPDWRVAGLISEGPYNRGLSLVTKVSSSPHLSTHQNLKSLRRGQVGFNFVLHSDGLNNSTLTPGCVPRGNCGQNVHFKERRGGSDLWRPGCSSQIDFRSHPLDDHCQHIPSPHLPHFPQNFPLITPNRSKSTLPQNLLILHPACTPGYSTLASGPFGGCF